MNVNSKNKILNILLVALVVIASIVFINNYDFSFKTLTTDSGFDADFDSDSGSGSGGGSYGGGYSGSSSSSGGSILGSIVIEIILAALYWNYIFLPITNSKLKASILLFVRMLLLIPIGLVLETIYILDIAIFLIYMFVFKVPVKISNNATEQIDYKIDISQERLEKYGITNIKELKQQIYEIYVKIQEAWSVNDIDKVRHLLSDEIYNKYKMDITTMISKNQRNEMSDFEFINAYIIKVSEKNNSKFIYSILEVYCKDYMINTTNNKVTRGKNTRINHYTYMLTFKLGNSVSIINCPSCNAKLSNKGTSTICEYCGSVIERESDELVLIDKKMIKQGIKK